MHNDCTSTIENSRGYATETNLRRALERTGLVNAGLRYMVMRKSDGKFTALFLVTEYVNKHGGYVGVAAQHGFASV